ncbi:MAG: hypothetical protein CVU44_18615 [Chloroflexi bacterium HGW-Chloroflexi-6]|nr:MAG: hypothetical protein CVU44_18615 [Chloroflexi bacterium HGW-Chloroflexi-6]
MKSKPWLIFILFIGIAGLAYLPLLAKFGYAFDDWYLMWSAKAYSPQAFFPIFSIDRPLRAYLMFPAYLLFGENPLWYNLSAFALRVTGAFLFWWMLRMLWPRAQTATMGMALLFVIYPGFLSQPNAIDYQSHIAALALAMFSLALTVKAFTAANSTLERIAMLIGSAVVGWLYLGLMEYYIGFELVRALLVGLLALRAEIPWPQRVKKALIDWLPLSVVPFGFVFWRVFIFVGERKATDAGAQLALAIASPLRAALGWAMGLFQDIFQTVLMAWVLPLAQLWGRLSAWQIAAGLVLGILGAFVAGLALKNNENEDRDWRVEVFWLGAAIVVGGLIPVVLANRSVEFPYYSRYTLISSTGVAMMAVALVFSLPGQKLRQIFFSTLIFLSILTHFANSVNAANETASMRDFWWQVAWRAPMLEQNSTLIAQYPLAPMQEDYFVWGPANLIYYPQKLYDKDIQPALFAALPTDETLQKVLARERQEYDKRRNIITYANYRNILVLVQPTTKSCVRILGPDAAHISALDADIFIQMAPFSEIERVQAGSGQPTPPYFAFGAEPEHGWCYYYQKASLARQYGDWQAVLNLGSEARLKNLSPYDEIEWIPFLQAEALLGEPERLTEIGAQMKDEFARQQACLALRGLDGVSSQTASQIDAIFCVSE